MTVKTVTKMDPAGKVIYRGPDLPRHADVPQLVEAVIQAECPKLDVLERLWGILHQALVLQAGTGGSPIDGDVVNHGKTESRPPTDAGEELRSLEERWGGCRSKADRKAVLRDAIELYYDRTHTNPDPKRFPGTQEWREAIAKDQRPSREVGQSYGISHTEVCKIRKEFPALRRQEAVK